MEVDDLSELHEHVWDGRVCLDYVRDCLGCTSFSAGGRSDSIILHETEIATAEVVTVQGQIRDLEPVSAPEQTTERDVRGRAGAFSFSASGTSSGSGARVSVCAQCHWKSVPRLAPRAVGAFPSKGDCSVSSAQVSRNVEKGGDGRGVDVNFGAWVGSGEHMQQIRRETACADKSELGQAKKNGKRRVGKHGCAFALPRACAFNK